MPLHFYADQESIELLASARRKALLIGGDFGYGNFGDVLQHIGAVRHVKAWSELAAVSVFSLDALSRHVSAASLRQRYAVDALLFVTEMPIASGKADRLGLQRVSALCNVSFVHLYGGGYLNAMWGGFVLGVAEHFLSRLPGVAYAISGQQLSSGFEQRTREHVEAFGPQLVGMRDRASLARAHQAGVQAAFSFDDAVEPLLALRSRLELREGDGAFIHLNSSDYTGNDEALAKVLAHMRDVDARLDGRGRPVLLQAFQDAREEVVDTIETVKRLEAGFPFSVIETALLVRAILEDEGRAPCVLQGRFGYSCSYHVTLWLQLNGIPCWLRGSNDYYEQKREALGIAGGFEEFLARLPRPDHGENLRARALWLAKLQAVLQSAPAATNRIDWEPLDSRASQVREFRFKGEPRLQARLDETWAALTGLREEKERLDLRVQQAQDMAAHLENATAERDSLQGRVGELDASLTAMRSRFDELRGRLDAVTGQLDQRVAEQAATAAKLLEATGLAAVLKEKMQQMGGIESSLRLRLDTLEAESAALRQALAAAEAREVLVARRMDGVSARVTALGAECRAQERRAREAEAGWYAACQGNEQLKAELDNVVLERNQSNQRLEAVEARLAACNEQLTAVGGEARHYREAAEWNHSALLEVTERERAASVRLQEAMQSRSWRWTRPARVIGRYFRTGRFDPAGDIGLFEIARILGRKAPMPAAWRSSLGRWLQHFRRR